MSIIKRKSANVVNETGSLLRAAPAELPADGSIQLAYKSDGTSLYVYYDYDANVLRNYQTDEEISIDGLYEANGTSFHFFAEDSTPTEAAVETNSSDPAPQTSLSEPDSPAEVLSQNTEAIEEANFSQPEINVEVNRMESESQPLFAPVASNPTPTPQHLAYDSNANSTTPPVAKAVSVQQPSRPCPSHASVNVQPEKQNSATSVTESVSQIRNNPHVRGIVEYILNGNGNVDRISEKEQELFKVSSLKDRIFAGYADLVKLIQERRRELIALVNDSVATIRSIISSLVNENKDYCARIKENARIVSEKQFVIYDELATNFQGIVQTSPTGSDGSNYEQMKSSYIECWNLRKKILENLRIMYDFEIVITRLQYISDAHDLTVSRVLGALNSVSKEIESSVFDFTSACTNRELIGQNVVLSEGVKRFRESSRALLNEVDSVLVGIDKRRLFERWNHESERPRVPARFEKIRQDLPTMQIGNMSFLNEESDVVESNIHKPEFKRPKLANLRKSAHNTDFVSLSPTSTLKINNARR